MHRGNRPNWSIRPATLADAGAVADILRGLGWFSFIDNEAARDTEARVRKHLEMSLADTSHTVIVAEDAGGTLVGYVAAHWLPYLMLRGPEGYVSELFLVESARGGGLGTRLLETVKDMAISRGCSRLMLVNRKTRESYRRGFYRNLGWEEREEFANFVLHLPPGGQ
jgi:GNAT superfamily N-acetyltransferase